MKIKKIWLLSKTTGEAFTLGAGIAGIVLSVIATFVSIPLFIIFPFIGGIGIIFAAASAYYAIRKLNKKEFNRKNKQNNNDAFFAHKIKHHYKIKKDVKQFQHNANSTITIVNAFPQWLEIIPEAAPSIKIPDIIAGKPNTILNDSVFQGECDQDNRFRQ
ncbi:MAG: hypothetical protein A3F42_08075 [Gammaproteobacteria bacterium RIFCSPHIGHO2_12_FULL_37_34]|nr:MAG: hypothetical protein A3F42_08075 [Gammaproteobacteria bacterium RIFCSPHIGHO2_12_FULL_37_34]